MIDETLRKPVRELSSVKNCLGEFFLEKGQIGEGGTSIVRAARYKGSDAKYAIKFLLVNVAKKETTAYKRFKQAYINLSAIQHLGCVLPMIHLDVLPLEEFKIPYIIMPRIDDDMKRHFDKGAITFEEFEKIFNRLLQTIQQIHDHGIVHRDIKPENVFIKDGRLLLGDFDIAKFDDVKNIHLVETKPTQRLANYLFSAPEQADSKIGKVCEASDWYAFAQVLHWLVKGVTVKGLSKIKLDLSENRYRKYECLFENLLQQDPGKRLKSANEIAEFLKREEERQRFWAEHNQHIKQLEVFDDIVCKYSCNVGFSAQTVVRIESERDKSAILNCLKLHLKELNLWAAYEGCDFEIRNMRHVNGGVWSFGMHEILVDQLYIFRHFSSGGHMIIVQGGFQTSVRGEAREWDSEEVILWRGHQITRAEYDNGWAIVDGRRLRIGVNCTITERFLRPKLFFLSPSISPIHERDTFKLIENIGKMFQGGGHVDESVLKKALVNKVKRSREITMFD